MSPVTVHNLPGQNTWGATIIADPGLSGWAPLYGMLKDRYGVTWTLDIATPLTG
ncbi:hypothetical protein [Streptomyces minutiscleroticus]|uniref:hypothetical protein n=1 Tax=Streptomyces minutiscleroticus TaxID=68238 RepID=UPI0033264252